MIGPIIDVADSCGRGDWRLVKAHGIQAAILHMAWNGMKPDREYQRNCDGCRYEGIPFGSYYPSEPWVDWRKEAEFIQSIYIPGQLPLANDVERWRAITRVNQEANVINLLGGMANMSGRRPLLYTNLDYLLHKLRRLPDLKTVADLWFANPTGTPGNPVVPEWGHPLLHQYTWKARVPGFNADVDLSVFLGSDELWRTWVHQPTALVKFKDMSHKGQMDVVEKGLQRLGLVNRDGYPLT